MASDNVTAYAGASLPIRSVTNAGADGGARQQVVTLADPDGTIYAGGARVQGGYIAPVTQAISATAVALTSGTSSTTAIALMNCGASEAALNVGNITVVLAGGAYTALTINFEGSLDGTNWFPWAVTRSDGSKVVTVESFTAAVVKAWEVAVPGLAYFRVRCSAITSTSNPTLYLTGGGMLYEPSPSVITLPPPSKQSVNFETSGGGLTATTTSAGLVSFQSLVMATTAVAPTVTTALTAYQVPVGQTLRITSAHIAQAATGAANAYQKLGLYIGAAAPAATSTACLTSIAIGDQVGTTPSYAIPPMVKEFPDGLDIPGGLYIAFIQITGAASSITWGFNGYLF